MQIGGSITTIERLHRGCRIRDPDLLWTNFARVGFNEAGKQYSENETKEFFMEETRWVSQSGTHLNLGHFKTLCSRVTVLSNVKTRPLGTYDYLFVTIIEDHTCCRVVPRPC
jgi:hypothetical protein